MTPAPAPIELSIVMPCLDEAATVGRCVEKARSFLENRGIAGEVVVGDNGSADGSAALAAHAGAVVVPVARRGYGAALDGAIRASRGRWVVMGDADDTYDFSDLDPFVGALRSGADLVMGNRFLGGIREGAMPWSHRVLGNPALSRIGRWLFRAPVGDFHCGLRAFSREAYDRLGMRSPGMEYASEMVVRASLLGLRIAEVPTVLRSDGRGRRSHLRPWRDAWRHLWFMLLLSPRWLFFWPGAAQMALGAAMFGVLALRPLHAGGVESDIHGLSVAGLLAVVGYQGLAVSRLLETLARARGYVAPGGGRRPRPAFSLEAGLLAGATLIVLGLAGLAASLLLWKAAEPGPMDPRTTLRLVIPSCTALGLGLQVAFDAVLRSAFTVDLG